MKQAQIFQRKGDLFILPSCQTTDGVWMGVDPVVRLDENASHETLGEAILRAITSSKQGVPHPLDWNIPTTSLFQLAGVKSCNEFERNAKHITVQVDDKAMRITPWRNLGPGRGFGPLVPTMDEILVAADSSTSEIGVALNEALKRCQ